MKRVAFIGTGNIAHAHAQALGMVSTAELVSVVDLDVSQAEAFAKAYKVPIWGSSMDFQSIDVVHILTPPPTHFKLASQVLKQGRSVFLEKPMAETAAECMKLQELAHTHGGKLRVNQNYAYAPAHKKLTKALQENRIGPVRSISCEYTMPLRQLAARQFGHWMFDSDRNLLLEQVVHPLSLLDDIAGPLSLEALSHSAPEVFATGTSFVTEWSALLKSDQVNAHLHVRLGASYPVWKVTVVGEDGQITADYLNDTTLVSSPGAYIDFAEDLFQAAKQSISVTGQQLSGAAKYMGAQLGVFKRNDSFFLSIKDSVTRFYDELDTPSPNLTGEQGARLVSLCCEMAERTKSAQKSVRANQESKDRAKPSILLLGGTGFIGAYLLRRLLAGGHKVGVLARNIKNLPDEFHDPDVTLYQGSISDRELLADAMAGADSVVNLAHGGGGDDWEAIKASLVDGAVSVAQVAQEKGVSKLIHIGSIAALYLGDPNMIIKHDTSVDTEREERALYARAKAEADLELLTLHREKGLPVSIFRPGVVLGEGTSPFHSGIGFYNREQVCLGWNAGTNPLPLVLVEDVAEALCAALTQVDADKLAGQCFNLVGDVRLTARDYTTYLASRTHRHLRYRPQLVWQQQAGEVSKWLIKRAGGRKVDFPSIRDLKSRGLVSQFDTTFEKDILGWHPVNDEDTFIERSISIHAKV